MLVALNNLTIILFFVAQIFWSTTAISTGNDVNDYHQEYHSRFKREPQRRNNQNFHDSNIQRSFSTGDLDKLGRRGKPQSCNLNYDFDFFVLAIQWAPSFCLEKQECNRQIVQKRKWLIHGLWQNKNPNFGLRRTNRDIQIIQNSNNPVLLGSHDAEFCCGPRYNSSMFQGKLYKELLEKWPTLYPNGKHHSFWQHEWQKHGTCARQIRPLQNQQKYFETILGLYNQFNLSAIPFQSNKSYKIQEIHDLMEPRVANKHVRLKCSLINANQYNSPKKPGQENSNQRLSIFTEVHICLNKQLQPINCTRRDDNQCRRNILFS